MNEFSRIDQKRWLTAMFLGAGAAWSLGGIALAWVAFRQGFWLGPLAPLLSVVVLVAGGLTLGAIKGRADAMRKRFKNPHYLHLYTVANERYLQLRSDLQKSRGADHSEVSRLLPLMEQVLNTVYLSLRQADAVMVEVALTERPGHLLPMVRPEQPGLSRDQQVQELYQLADRNIAEYRQNIERLTRSVRRTEAQAEVFVTTVDVLRARLLTLRLGAADQTGKHQEFVAALHQAKSQLEDVDRSLRELDFAREMAGNLDVDLEALVQRTIPPPPPPAEERTRL